MTLTPEEIREKERGYERKYREANREKIRERHRLWVAENPDRAKDNIRTWREKHPEKNMEYCRKYAEANQDKIREKARARKSSPEERKKASIQAAIRYRENREVLKEKSRVAQKLMSSEQRFVRNHRYRANKMGSIGSVTENEVRLLVNYYERTCAYCLNREATQIDHIVPLSRGGANGIENLVPSCGLCNTRKNSRSFEDHVERETAIGRDEVVSVEDFWAKRIAASAFLK